MLKTDQQLIYEIGVSLLPGIGSVNGKSLVAYCGGAEAVFKQKKAHLEKIEGIGAKLANAIAKGTLLRKIVSETGVGDEVVAPDVFENRN